MDKNIIIDECFNCKKKKDIGDNWRTCKLKCSYKYKRKENDYITRLEQENKQMKSVLEEIKEVLKFYADSWVDEKIYPNLHYDNTKAKEGLSRINEVLNDN